MKPDFCYKYTLIFFLILFSLSTPIACVQKHKFDTDKKQLSEKKMSQVLADVFLMEAYVNENTIGLFPDSVASIKKSLYKPILLKHKIDSADFYATLNYYQVHPKEFLPILNQVDTILSKIKPLDSTTITEPATQDLIIPKNLDTMESFKAQEAAMRNSFLKRNKLKNQNNSK